MSIGENSNVASTGSNITANVSIGKYCSIGTHVQIHTMFQHACIEHPELVSTKQLNGYPPITTEDKMIIGNDVWVGRNAVLLGNITVGDGAIIGAFAVVAKDILPYSVIIGNPARVLRMRFNDEQIKKLLHIQWWNWTDTEVEARLADFLDIDIFLSKYYKP